MMVKWTSSFGLPECQLTCWQRLAGLLVGDCSLVAAWHNSFCVDLLDFQFALPPTIGEPTKHQFIDKGPAPRFAH